MNIFLMLLAAYGLCFGLMNDKAKVLTDQLKKIPLFQTEKGTFFERMFICAYCTGFHCGWMVYLLSVLHTGIRVSSKTDYIVEGLTMSFASAIFCYAVDVIVQWFER